MVDVNHINSYSGYVIHLEGIFEYKPLTSIKFQIGLKFLSVLVRKVCPAGKV